MGIPPKIYRLPGHEENRQQIIIHDGENLQDALERNQDSMLMAYFKMNERDPEAHKFTYVDMPKHYAYVKTTRSCKRRYVPLS